MPRRPRAHFAHLNMGLNALCALDEGKPQLARRYLVSLNRALDDELNATASTKGRAV